MKQIIEFFINLFKKMNPTQNNQPVTPPEPIPIPTQNVEVPTPLPVITPREILYRIAKDNLGKNVRRIGNAPAEYACAESVWNILNLAFPNRVDFVVTLSTIGLFNDMSSNQHYQKVTEEESLFGDIIICVTGSGNGKLSNGHTGVLGKNGIMSNSSSTGLWSENYTLQSWYDHYNVIGGFEVHFFRRIK